MFGAAVCHFGSDDTLYLLAQYRRCPPQLPATIHQAEITSNLRASNVVPALIADLGDEAGWRYVEFVTANIRNPHTRRVIPGACSRFFSRCEQRGLTLVTIRPHDVATYHLI